MLAPFQYFIYTEWLLLFRRSHEWLYPIGFFLIVISLFPLCFTPDPLFLQKYFSGCAWIAALFASVLSIGPLFHADTEEGYLEQLILSQSLMPFVISKLMTQWMVCQLPLILLTPFIGWLFHLSSASLMALTLSLLLGTPILILLGATGVALTLGLKQQGVLLGLLILPLSTPIIIFGASLAAEAEAGLSIMGPIAFLAGLCVLSMTLLPWTIATTLQMSIDD